VPLRDGPAPTVSYVERVSFCIEVEVASIIAANQRFFRDQIAEAKMVTTERRNRIAAGPVTFIVRHELWDGNIQDHADQGVAIVVAGSVQGKETRLLRFNCFDVGQRQPREFLAPDARPGGNGRTPCESV